MWTNHADFVILMGGRAWCSLLGLLLITIGTWQVQQTQERQDQEPPSSVSSPTHPETSTSPGLDAEYAALPETTTNTTTTTTTESGHPFFTVWPFLVRALGWILLAFTPLQTAQKWWGWQAEPFAIVSCITFLGMGLCELALPLSLQAVDLPSFCHPRGDTTWRLPWISLGWILQATWLMLVQHPPAIGGLFPVWCVAIALAPVLFYHALVPPERPQLRQYQEQMQAAQPPDSSLSSSALSPIVFHLGGPLYVFGVFFFWVGLNAIQAKQPNGLYLPVELYGSRTVASYIGATLVLLVAWMASYALDEMPRVSRVVDPSTKQVRVITKTKPQDFQAGPGLGMNGFFFGEVWETKIVFGLVWLLFSLAVFLPYMTSLELPLFLMFTMLAIGLSLSIVYERAMREPPTPQEDGTTLTGVGLAKWSKLLPALFGFWCIEIWAHIDWVAFFLSLMGSVCFLLAHVILHHDRKRGGRHFIATGQDNPRPLVYSYGTLLMPLGLLLLAWALSLRYYV